MRGDEKREVWEIFAPHHYLSGKLNFAADCWVLKWDGRPIGFCAVLPQPTGTANYCKRISRLVILPDYQGLGVGTRFLEAICQHYVSQGYKTYIRTAHVKLASHFEKYADFWRPTARNGKKGELNGVNQNPHSVNRECFSYEYVGPDFAKPHVEFVVDELADIDMAEMKKFLTKLKKENYLTIVHSKVKEESMLNALCKELGIRTELLYVNGRMSKKRIGERKLIEMSNWKNPVFGEVM